jgi:SET domain-containing protein
MYLNNLFSSEKLIVKRSNIHRWGVFAKKPIKKYEILEEFPYFEIPVSESNNCPSCIPYTYTLNRETNIIGMGFCGLYNHSFSPNVNYEIDLVNQVMRHYAIKNIHINEELTLDYGEENAKGFLENEKTEINKE